MASGDLFLLLGVLILASAWLPLFVDRLPITVPVVAVVVGYAFFAAAGIGRLTAQDYAWTEQMTRLALILAIMAAGISIDRPWSHVTWQSAWRLLAIGLPLTLILMAALGVAVLHLPLGLAVLVAAVLTPTDPVLAGQVEVGPPGSGEEREVRFALTTEAGVNDGLAAPFVTLGLLLVTGGTSGQALLHWFGFDLLWKTMGGALLGLVVGRVVILGNRLLPNHLRLAQSGSGIVVLGLTFLAFGLAEVVSANGFVAVFAAAVGMRNAVRTTDYLRQLHAFAVDVERVVTTLVLAIFGGAIWLGILGAVTWRQLAFVAASIIVARPLGVLAASPGLPFSTRERLAASYLGIRGLASLYYVVLAVQWLNAATRAQVLSIVALFVLTSAVLYGATSDWVMRWVDGDPPAENGPDGQS